MMSGSTTGPHRRGMALIVVMGLLGLVLLLAGAFLRAGLNARKRIVLEERQAQVSWLVSAGLERARARLSRDPGYEGETWKLDGQEMGGRGSAEVMIRVTTPAVAANAASRHIEVSASYPSGSTSASTRGGHYELTIPTKPTGDR